MSDSIVSILNNVNNVSDINLPKLLFRRLIRFTTAASLMRRPSLPQISITPETVHYAFRA